MWKFFQMHCSWQRAGPVLCSCVKLSVNALSFAPLGLRALARGMNDLTSFSQSRREKTSSGHEASMGGKKEKNSQINKQRGVNPSCSDCSKQGAWSWPGTARFSLSHASWFLADVDECLSQQHNCSRGTTCINTGGGFECVSPECPRSHGNISYVKTSPL